MKYFYISGSEVENSFGGLEYVHPYILDVFEYIRSELGHPIRITSLCRSYEKQAELREQGLTNVVYSPHMPYMYSKDRIEVYKGGDIKDGYKVHSFAMDLARPSVFKTNEEFKDYIRKDLKLKDIRIGWWSYQVKRRDFIHIDCAFLLPGNLKKQLSEKTFELWRPSEEW